MPIRFGIKELTINDLQSYSPPFPGICVLVGPNNSGKSYALRRVWNAITIAQSENFDDPEAGVISTLEADDPQSINDWFDLRSKPYKMGDEHVPVVLDEYNAPQTREHITELWSREDYPGKQGSAFASNLLAFFALKLDAENRLALIDPVTARNPAWPPINPLHVMWYDVAFEKSVSERLDRAFGIKVSINRLAPSLSLLIGSPIESLAVPPDRATLDELLSRPVLDRSMVGDGVRSFAGMLLQIGSGRHSLLLIDEPELFLHPPQAKQLGQAIAEMVDPNTQVFIATHSADLLQGLLSRSSMLGDNGIDIVRLTSTASGRHAQLLERDRVTTMSQDPLYRGVRAFDSLFFTATVVCEGDSDALVYSACTEHITASPDQAGAINWINVGGKASVIKMMGTLRDAGVRAACVVDFDFLRQQPDVELMLEIIEHPEPDRVRSVLDGLNAELAPGASSPTVSALKALVNPIFGRRNNEPLTSAEIADIKELIRSDDGWKAAKTHGLRALRQTYTEVSDLLAELSAEYGVFIVPHGELEGWFPGAGRKSGLASRLLEMKMHESPPSDLREFLTGLITWLFE